MKLHPQTLKILKNFAKINNSLFIKKSTNGGTDIKTISSGKNILASFRTEDIFPVDVCLYDLTRFLGVLNMSSDYDLEFDETCVWISNNISQRAKRTKIVYCDPEIIVYPTKEIHMPDVRLSFSLSGNDIDYLGKMSATLGLPEILITQENHKIIVRLLDSKNPSSNTSELTVGDIDSDESFEYYINMDNLKMVDGDYQVELTDKIISRFTHQSIPVTYWVAMNMKSKSPHAPSESEA